MAKSLTVLAPAAARYHVERPEAVATATSLSADFERQAALFHALSDPRRLTILTHLQAGERCVCHLQDAIDLGQSLLSFHLKALRDAGLVVSRRDGRWMHYRLSPAGWSAAHDAIAALRPTATTGTPSTHVVCCD